MKASYYEEVLADHRRLVRELDAILSAPEKPAKQASLCDLIPQAKQMRKRLDELECMAAEMQDHIWLGGCDD